MNQNEALKKALDKLEEEQLLLLVTYLLELLRDQEASADFQC